VVNAVDVSTIVNAVLNNGVCLGLF
jgi:hypothetical protein